MIEERSLRQLGFALNQAGFTDQDVKILICKIKEVLSSPSIREGRGKIKIVVVHSISDHDFGEAEGEYGIR